MSCGSTGVVCGTRIVDPSSKAGECVIKFGALGFLWQWCSCRGTENRPTCIRICSEIVAVGDLVVGAWCWLGACVALHNSGRITLDLMGVNSLTVFDGADIGVGEFFHVPLLQSFIQNDLTKLRIRRTNYSMHLGSWTALQCHVNC
jgi:hypothetical protein